MQSHCQQGGKIHLGPGVEVMTALQGTDKLQIHYHTHINRQMTSYINHPDEAPPHTHTHSTTHKLIKHNMLLNNQKTNASENNNYQGKFSSAP